MQDRQRVLPAWMVKHGEERNTGAPVQCPPEGNTVDRKRAQRVTVYCMNEAELVNTAFAFLAEERGSASKKQASVVDKNEGFVKEKRKWVSESELDGLAEEATVPFIDISGSRLSDNDESPDIQVTKTQKLGHYSQSAKQPSKCIRGAKTHHRNGEPTTADQIRQEGTEDDPFKLIREIFFT
ncbi:cell cycle regulator of non-homologous end joining [Amia ocellicauda]|uniref:cell cycle regulator of non-homologous end joining n=1 Tax=Amia ocellicauda TaxID=2972642 RepID=UPI003463BE45